MIIRNKLCKLMVKKAYAGLTCTVLWVIINQKIIYRKEY